MKKIFAIVMLCSILFNLGGYTLLFQYLINRTDSSLYEQINDNRYKMNDLVEIKIPAVQKTVEDEDEYAPVSGQVKLRDTLYNFAYLKMTRDTMYLLCLPNKEKGRLKNARIIYSKQINDISYDKSRVPVMKISTFEGDHSYYTVQFKAAIVEEKTKKLPYYNSLNTINTSIGVPGQPPEVSPLS